MNGPSVNALAKWVRVRCPDVSDEQSRVYAKALKDAMQVARHGTFRVDHVLDMANLFVRGHGIRAIFGKDYHGTFYGPIELLEVNVGDSVSDTLMYSVRRVRFIIDNMENLSSKHPKRYE